MQLNQEDLKYFVPFLLLDEARRSPSGKRQTMSMNGFWMSRLGAHRCRVSDLPWRRRVCIHVLSTIGELSVSNASAAVADILGLGTETDVNVIRVDYYECKSKLAQFLGEFYTQFINWRRWVYESNDETLHVVLDLFKSQFGQQRHTRLSNLIEGLKSDPLQRNRNNELRLEQGLGARTRIESNVWDPIADWQLLATDLWILGRFHAELGERNKAQSCFEQALDLWRTRGHNLPDRQTAAIELFSVELTRVRSI
jgi:hypothetical protein